MTYMKKRLHIAAMDKYLSVNSQKSITESSQDQLITFLVSQE